MIIYNTPSKTDDVFWIFEHHINGRIIYEVHTTFGVNVYTDPCMQSIPGEEKSQEVVHHPPDMQIPNPKGNTHNVGGECLNLRSTKIDR